MMKFNNSPLVILLLLFIASSCSIERRLALDYVQQLDSTIILYFPVSEIYFKQYDSTPEKLNKEWLTDQLTDSTLLANYNAVFIEEIKKSGIEILFPEQSDVFFENEKGFIVNMAQFELEEIYREERDQEQFDDTEYYYDYPVRYVIASFWMETNALNIEKSYPVIFSSYFASDKVNNIFLQNQLSGEIKIENNVSQIGVPRIKELIQQSAKQNAENLIDDIINRHVLNSLNQHYRSKVFHYNIDDSKLERIDILPYILMEE